MSGSAPSDPGQAPGGQPQAGTPAQPPQAGSGQTQPPSSQPSSQFQSQGEAEAAFQRAVKDRQDANAEAAELKRKLKTLEDAQLTEAQKRERDLAELQGQRAEWLNSRQEWLLEKAVLLAAPEAGISPALALRVIDRAALEFNEDGTPKDVKAALASAIKTYGLQSGPPAPQPGQFSPTNPGGAPGSPIFTEAQLEDLDFYAKNREAIMQARREGRIAK